MKKYIPLFIVLIVAITACFFLKAEFTRDFKTPVFSGPVGADITQSTTSESFATWLQNTNTNVINLNHDKVEIGGDLSGSTSTPTIKDLTITGEGTGTFLYYDGSGWEAFSTSTNSGYILTATSGSPYVEWSSNVGSDLGISDYKLRDYNDNFEIINEGSDTYDDTTLSLLPYPGGVGDESTSISIYKTATTSAYNDATLDIGWDAELSMFRIGAYAPSYEEAYPISIDTIHSIGDTATKYQLFLATSTADIPGNVGIGTSTPSGLLHVDKGSTTTTVVFGSSGSPACIKMRDNDDGGWTYFTALNGSLNATTTSCE